MDLIFSGGTVNECLEKASSKIGISKDSLKYKVIKEERRFFKKKVEIQILNDEKTTEENKEVPINNEEIKSELCSGAKVEQGKIIVKKCNGEQNIITIKTCEGVHLFLNGKECDFIENATETDEISYEFEEYKPERKLDIGITSDKMEAYVTVISIPQFVYELEDQEYTMNLRLKKKKISKKYLPKYTKEELRAVLNSKGIRNGIIEEELENICRQNEVKNVLIAKGQAAIDDVEDKINLFFKEFDDLIEKADSEKKIDYRNRYSIANVNVGDIIAEVVSGKAGSDGTDVLGLKIKRKTAKNLVLKIGSGCRKENNKIISEIEGKPSFKSNVFNVNKVYEVQDVNLESGNIDFIGNVEIARNIEEGMEVIAGNELFVGKNIDCAKVSSGGQITIKGNVINSTIIAGANNVKRTEYLRNLLKLDSMINELYQSIKQIKENNILGNRKDGEIIKVLIENKFKLLNQIIQDILNYYIGENIIDTPIISFLKEKLIGFGPLSINDAKELSEFRELLSEEIEELEEIIITPSDIYMEYSQGATVESSGNVFITGKGQYTSNITALHNIEFTGQSAVCRGGVLSAESEIKLKTVGSISGVGTILKVSKEGRITADVAYGNTVFCFGEKQIMLEVASRNLVAYLDKQGEITIDKLLL